MKVEENMTLGMGEAVAEQLVEPKISNQTIMVHLVPYAGSGVGGDGTLAVDLSMWTAGSAITPITTIFGSGHVDFSLSSAWTNGTYVSLWVPERTTALVDPACWTVTCCRWVSPRRILSSVLVA